MAKPKSYTITTAPTAYPVTVAEAKEQLLIDHALDDDLLTAKIATATQIRQARDGRYYMQHQVKAFFDYAYLKLQLHAFPLVSVDAVKYRDAAGVTQTLVADTDYYVNTAGRYPTVELQNSYITDSKPAPVWVEFTAGYGASGANEAAQQAAVPPEVKEAILVMVAGMYENRENPLLPAEGRLTVSDSLTYHLRTHW